MFGMRESSKMEVLVDLSSSQITVMLPVKDIGRARSFYENQLALSSGMEKSDGRVVYRSGGTEIALIPKEDGTKAEHTAVSFKVRDIRETISALEGRGVVFADYDLPGLKTVDHVCVLGSEKAAWFSDPEGNILCLHEDIADPS
jgi:catechol-2,3-dioxygenase